MNQAPRERWTGRTGFVLAAIGSAVGLGNMWRFSYLTAEYGGAAFVVLYVALTILIGIPVLLAELAMGRGANSSPISALGHFGGNAWKPGGALFVASGFLILSYYSVIAGWTLRYALDALFGGFDPAAKQYFIDISQGRGAIIGHVVFMAGTTLIVARGIRAGIERTSLILMPVLFMLICGLAVYGYTLEGAGAGYRFYLETDFSKILDAEVFSTAAGQAFFSLSLGMGAMMTYASYLSPERHLPNESLVIGGADFVVAFVAGLVVFPLIFALGLSADVGESTLGALFITLPKAFSQMGIAGQVVGFLFFAALAVGALTSAISLLEVVTASAMDTLGWPRTRSALVFGVLITLLGIPPALKINILDWMDKLAGQLFLVTGGLLLSIFVGWVMKDPFSEVRRGAEHWPWFPVWRFLLRVPIPLALLVVLYSFVQKIFFR
jgi:NSS family neurotransmitter:Na+ symporter